MTQTRRSGRQPSGEGDHIVELKRISIVHGRDSEALREPQAITPERDHPVNSMGQTTGFIRRGVHLFRWRRLLGLKRYGDGEKDCIAFQAVLDTEFMKPPQVG